MGINVSQVEQLSAALGAASEEIAAVVTELDRRLAILSQQWSGTTAEAYGQAMSQAAAALAAMNAVLGQTGKVTLTVADRHREAEIEVQQLWG